MSPPSCDSVSASILNNEAHSCKNGWIATNIKYDCVEILNFTVTSSKENGLFAAGRND